MRSGRSYWWHCSFSWHLGLFFYNTVIKQEWSSRCVPCTLWAHLHRGYRKKFHMGDIWANRLKDGFASRHWSKVRAVLIPLMVTVRFGLKGEPGWSWNLAEGRCLHAELESGCAATESSLHLCNRKWRDQAKGRYMTSPSMSDRKSVV